MASRILLNSAEEIDTTLYTGYISLVLRGTGLIRDTGVQSISGQKFFYDTITFYSGLNVSGDFVPSGDVVGNLIPKTDNLYDLGSASNEWRNGYFDGFLRTDALHVDENAGISGNLLVGGHVTGSGDGHFYGGLTVNGHSQVGSLASLGTAVFSDTLFAVGDSQVGKITVTGDFVPSNLAANLTPKTDNLYDIGSSTNEIRNIFVDGTGRIDILVVDENAIISSGLSIGNGLTVTGSSTSTLGNQASSYQTSGSGAFGTLFVTGTGIPSSTGSIGIAGQIVWGSGYLYVCTGTNAWGRTHLTGWT